MNKAIILAIVAAAFSHAAIAADTVKPTEQPHELKCPAGTKLVRGAHINIQKDGSGTLVEDNSCAPLDTSADASK